MPESLYLVDGHSQIYRAYYAPMGNLTAPSGEPTRATHVFFQMLLNLVRNRAPHYLAVVLDTSDETVFRRAIYPEYKAKRDPPPEDLPAQTERIISLLKAIGMPVLQKPTYEADDIMATLAARLAGPELHVHLVSRDKDLEQLLSEHVSLYDPFKDEVITPDVLRAAKGWGPEQAIEAQCLMGDSVDNVPGVVGIGPKKAADLLKKYGTVENIIARAAELTPKQRENVLNWAPCLEMCRRLLTLDKNVPVTFELAGAACSAVRWQAAEPIFRELGFTRLREQLPCGEPEDGGASTTPAPARRAPAAAPETDERRRTGWAARRLAAPGAKELVRQAAKYREPAGGEYRLVRTRDELAAFVEQLAQQAAFAFDTETTGTSPIDAVLVGLSLSWAVGQGAYIPVRSVFGEPLPWEQIREQLAPLFADPQKRKVGHHLKYDLLVLREAGLSVDGPLFDTMIAAFVLDPLRGAYGLDKLAPALFEHTMIPITDLIGKGRDQLSMDQIPLELITEYASEDADYTWRLAQIFMPLLEPAGLDRLFHETEMPLVAVLTDMEQAGISVDVEYLRDMGRQMAARLLEITTEVHKLAGVKFNLDSPKQLGEVLFDKLCYRVVRRTRTTRSTDAETLEALARETSDPLLTLLLEYRELQKLRGTYVEALPAARSRRTGRIHTSYHQTGAVTGRLSSSEPNLQNIPIRTEIGRQIRRAFIPRSPEERLIVADYSQVELRVLAHFCEDEGLQRAFAEDRDIHAVVAAEVNGVALEDVTKEMRARAKAVNFGLIYGQTAFGLAQTTGMSRTEAQIFIDRYFQRYPRIRRFIDQCIEDARRDGFVRTILGRQRPILDIDSRNRSIRAQAERLAVNTVVQGSAADLIKTAMIQLHRRIAGRHLPLRMLLQVHDELVCEAPAAEAERLAEEVREIMCGAIPLRVPLKVDVAVGLNWLEAK